MKSETTLPDEPTASQNYLNARKKTAEAKAAYLAATAEAAKLGEKLDEARRDEADANRILEEVHNQTAE